MRWMKRSGRTVADMQHDTVLRLAQVPGIVGIKEATGNIERAQWLIREVPEGFAIYSGDDPTAVALMLCGGQRAARAAVDGRGQVVLIDRGFLRIRRAVGGRASGLAAVVLRRTL